MNKVNFRKRPMLDIG